MLPTNSPTGRRVGSYNFQDFTGPCAALRFFSLARGGLALFKAAQSLYGSGRIHGPIGRVTLPSSAVMTA
jgi:hypothetical protein